MAAKHPVGAMYAAITDHTGHTIVDGSQEDDRSNQGGGCAAGAGGRAAVVTAQSGGLKYLQKEYSGTERRKECKRCHD